MESNQNRNVAIDFCRAAATLMVINSHMAICYPAGFQAFATGGACGNALFFFCSGFAPFLSSDNSDFFNWYKNRINRIVPSLIAMSIFAVLFWDIEWNIIYTLHYLVDVIGLYVAFWFII